ncbi:MAG: hypothetical protein ACXWNK_07135 [Vulcanimicrobiaceae bacterium]
MVKILSERWGALDADQSAALRRFLDDLEDVLASVSISAEYFERSLNALAKAYHAALVTGKWTLFIAILADALDHLESADCAPQSSSYRRLRAMVWENADLLPPEMTHFGGATPATRTSQHVEHAARTAGYHPQSDHRALLPPLRDP